LYERKIKKLSVLSPLSLNSIIFVSNFEREIYETKNLTEKKVKDIAKKVFMKYFERSEFSYLALNVPHIYSWTSSASYHGYGLAELAVQQWRDYFYKKYGYIVDNKNVGDEMRKVWGLGASKTFDEFVFLAMGKKLSPDAWLKDVTMTVKTALTKAKDKIKKLESVSEYKGPIKLNANINMVSGKKVIASNKKSFEDMSLVYKKWLRSGGK
jgi:Zn-dependent oligopeptidase